MAFRVRTLLDSDPPDSFPDPAVANVALGYPDGLIAIGGDLSAERLLAAYTRGIFPWYNDDQPLLWWSPEPRAVIYPRRFHMSRSLARALKSGNWEWSLNQEFATTIESCATNRGRHGTWITPDMCAAYQHMHELGHAHSVESWHQGVLAGGIYGIRIGNVFFGESMFSKFDNGSKVAISALISLCISQGISLLDCQLPSEHLRSLGMEEIPRPDFLDHLRREASRPAPLLDWRLPRQSASDLADLRMLAEEPRV